MEDVRRVRETLNSIREKAGLFSYRKFLLRLHGEITTLTRGPNENRSYDTTTEEHKAVASKTEKGQHLLSLLGFDADKTETRLTLTRDVPEVWTVFLKEAACDLIVSKGDPTAFALPKKAPVPLLVAHLFYHIYIRVQLLTAWTSDHVHQSITDEVTSSFAAIDESAARLQILDPESSIGIKWETAKVMVQVFLNDHGDAIDGDYTAVANSIELEVKQRVRHEGLLAIIPYLQNMHAVAGNTALGNMIWENAVSTYLRNSDAFPCGCMSNQYAETMVTVEQLMRESQKRALTADEMERLHVTVVWQTENFMRCFTSEFFESEGPVKLFDDEPAATVEIPRTPEERKQMLTESLESLSKDVGFFKMRNFVETVQFTVSSILDSGGDSMMSRYINQSLTALSAVSSETEVGLKILRVLGFLENEMLPGGMVLADYEANETTLRTFSGMAEEMLLLKLEEIPSVHAIDDVVSLFAFLAYTLRIRLRLQCAFTPPYMRSLIAENLQKAMLDFEVAIDRLELLPPESESRAVWTNLKPEFESFPQSPTPLETMNHISIVVDNLGERIALDLAEIFPASVINLISYLQNISAIASITRQGSEVDSGGLLIYMNTTESLLPDSFSAEFMEHNRTIRQIIDAALRSEMTDEQNASFHQLTVWQARHFLSHFRAGEIDMTACSAELVARARRQGLRLSPTLAAEDVASALPLISASNDGGGECDGEKVDKDRSEKEERGVVADRALVRKMLETTNDFHKLVTLCEDFDPDVLAEEVKTMVKEKRAELQSSKDDLEKIDEVLDSDAPPVVKVALKQPREKAVSDLEKVSLKLDVLRKILRRLDDKPLSLDASLSSDVLQSVLRDIGHFQEDVRVMRDLIVTSLDMMPEGTIGLLSTVLGIDRKENFREEIINL
eukprot:m.95370 g.95370  ORF g.95370 m.95370 type:complete len:903 (+) comp36848_c0_seq1:86-2794(+)